MSQLTPEIKAYIDGYIDKKLEDVSANIITRIC